MDGRQGAAGCRDPGDGLAAAGGTVAAARGGAVDKLGIVLLLFSCIAWGTSPVAMRLLVGETQQGLPVLPVLAMRYGCAGLLFLPLLFRRKVPWSGADWRKAIFAGLCGIALYNFLASYGQRTVAAGLTGLLDASEPLLILLFGAIAARRMPSPILIVTSIAGACGVGLMSTSVGATEGTAIGIVLILGSAAAWALYCVMVPNLIVRRGSLPVTAATMVFGAMPMVAVGAPHVSAALPVMDTIDFLALGWLIVGSSVISTLLWNIGSARLGAQRAGGFLYMIPVVSVLGGSLLLGESVSAGEIVGGAIVLIAVFVAQRW